MAEAGKQSQATEPLPPFVTMNEKLLDSDFPWYLIIKEKKYQRADNISLEYFHLK